MIRSEMNTMRSLQEMHREDDPHYYDMVINVSKTGVAGAASLILDYIRDKEEEKGGNAS